ncbi:unnamed protein product [Porites lobata]|uniref:Uncharacterized protein n=1 Tax=Porites lobata TaxID=104759 RepID=A0ABN8NRG0_9CNID|nr:unnamed protein product [Porites lobata]
MSLERAYSVRCQYKGLGEKEASLQKRNPRFGSQVGKDSQLCAKESHFEIGCPLRGIGNRLVRADPLSTKKYLLAEKYLISLALQAIEESSDYPRTAQSIPENYSNDNTKSLRESRPSSKERHRHFDSRSRYTDCEVRFKVKKKRRKELQCQGANFSNGGQDKSYGSNSSDSLLTRSPPDTAVSLSTFDVPP